MSCFRGCATTRAGRILGAATRRSGATARSRNNVGDQLSWSPEGFGREGRIVALRCLHGGTPRAAHRALHRIPSRPNEAPKTVHDRLQHA
jgi:hypothetical protein